MFTVDAVERLGARKWRERGRPGPTVNRVFTVDAVEGLGVGWAQLTCLKLLSRLLRGGSLLTDCELRLAADLSDVFSNTNSGVLALATEDTWGGGQGKTVVLTLMSGGPLGMGLMVVDLTTWPGWGLGGGRAGPSTASTPLTCVTLLEVRCWAELGGFCTSTPLTDGTRHGVICWVEGHGTGVAPEPVCGPGSTPPESVLARERVGRLISIKLGTGLSPRSLTGLAGGGGAGVPDGGVLSSCLPPRSRFLRLYMW